MLINGLQSLYWLVLNRNSVTLELDLGNPAVLLIEDVVFSTFGDAADIDDVTLFCFALLVVGFCWGFDVFALDGLTVFVAKVDLWCGCDPCKWDCADDPKVFWTDFESLLFVDTNGESSDDLLSLDDEFEVCLLFCDKLSLSDASSSGDESDDYSSSDVFSTKA